MNVLTVNAGSSSLRLALFTEKDGSLSALARRHFAPIPRDASEALREFLNEHPIEVTATSHRIVHGGSRLTAHCVLDHAVEAEIRRLAPLAPLHNPVALKWIAAARAVCSASTVHVGVFDTAFYARLPEVAATYALPREVSLRHGIRRYGFHGLAHRAMWKRWQKLRPATAPGISVISLQLGSGCSVTATRDGDAVDTSMGFSPLEGLVMATRSGDVDPGVLLYLQRTEDMSATRMERLLNEESGLLGVSGISADMRQLLASNDPSARRAVDLYCYRTRKYVGAYLAVLGSADAILIGGGVGEHAPAVREGILAGLQGLGIVMDPAANRTAIGTEAMISQKNSKTELWVLPVDEASLLAEEAVRLARPLA